MNRRRTRPVIATLFTSAAWVALLGSAHAAEPLAFYVNYSARVPTAPLVAHPLSIVHPDATVDLAAAHRAGNTVLAYVSVGEVAADAPYRAEVLPPGVTARVSVEQASPFGWGRYIGLTGTAISMSTFGASAPLKDLLKKFCFTVEKVVEAAKKQLKLPVA